jgi:hypothetical protein
MGLIAHRKGEGPKALLLAFDDAAYTDYSAVIKAFAYAVLYPVCCPALTYTTPTVIYPSHFRCCSTVDGSNIVDEAGKVGRGSELLDARHETSM